MVHLYQMVRPAWIAQRFNKIGASGSRGRHSPALLLRVAAITPGWWCSWSSGIVLGPYRGKAGFPADRGQAGAMPRLASSLSRAPGPTGGAQGPAWQGLRPGPRASSSVPRGISKQGEVPSQVKPPPLPSWNRKRLSSKPRRHPSAQGPPFLPSVSPILIGWLFFEAG